MNRHTFRARPPVRRHGDDGPVGPAAGVLAEVWRLREDLDAWTALLHEEQTPDAPGAGVRVLIDQAEDLRRRLRQAGDTCRGLLLAQPPPRQHGAKSPTALAVTAVCPGRAALVVAATSLHAAAHGIGPAASALYDQDHLRATMNSSAQITGRFLTTATVALQDATTADPAHPVRGLARPAPGPVRNLRLVRRGPPGDRRLS